MAYWRSEIHRDIAKSAILLLCRAGYTLGFATHFLFVLNCLFFIDVWHIRLICAIKFHSLTYLVAYYRYSGPLKNRIDEWLQCLSTTLEITDRWLAVQNLWLHLEAVFTGCADVARQLAGEARRFHNVDKCWQRVLQRVADTPNVVDCCVADDFIAHMLPHLRDQLELCQKSLAGSVG